MPGGLGKKGFRKLQEKVAKEYEKRGIDKERAQEWGRSTAGKVENEKKEAAK